MAVVQRVYAEALLEASREKDVLAPVREEFDAFAAALAGSDELRAFLRNPQVETETKLGALGDLLTGGNQIFLNFVHLLAEKGRIAEVGEVHEEFGRLLAREERVLELELDEGRVRREVGTWRSRASCGPASTNCRHGRMSSASRGRGSCRRTTLSVGAWNGISTTGPSSTSSRSR